MRMHFSAFLSTSFISPSAHAHRQCCWTPSSVPDSGSSRNTVHVVTLHHLQKSDSVGKPRLDLAANMEYSLPEYTSKGAVGDMDDDSTLIHLTLSGYFLEHIQRIWHLITRIRSLVIAQTTSIQENIQIDNGVAKLILSLHYFRKDTLVRILYIGIG